MNRVSISDAIAQAMFAAIVAFVVFGPVTGIILHDYDYVATLERPLVLALLVLIGRFAVTLYAQSNHQLTWLNQFLAPQDLHVTVAHPNQQAKYWICLIVLLAFSLPFFANNYWLSILILALIYVLLGLGLNIVVGLAGLLDLGFVAFYAVGAYTYALGALYLDLSFWTALPLGAVLAGCFGIVLGFPVLRMHGDYLAIVTLGFGEIIRLVLNNWTDFTGGPNGVSAPKPGLFGLEFSRYAKYGGEPFHTFMGIDYSRSYQYIFVYLILLCFVIAITYAVNRLQRMPIGRAWEALREDEIACRSLGINHVTTKLSAFSLGACIGGIGGAFFAAYQGFVNPSSFTFIESALILAIVVLGGMGSIVGVITAAILITLLPEVLRDFSQYRILVFGLVMVIMMVWRPRGLIRVKRYPISKESV